MLGARERHQLFSVMFELTYRCNWDCFFCYNDLNLKGEPLTLTHYCQALEELADMNVLQISLTGGEPLAHPNFFAIGAMCKDLGFITRIKSNGHAIRGKILERIVNEIDPQMIEVSIHGASAEVHDKQTRVEGSFERLITNIKGMKDAGLLVKANSTLTAWNEHEIAGIYRLAAELDIVLQVDPEVTMRDDGDDEPLSIRATSEGLRRLNEIRERLREEYERVEVGGHSKGASSPLPQEASTPTTMQNPVEENEPKNRLKNKAENAQGVIEEKQYTNYCGAGVSTLTVDPFGNVYPCVQWRVASGNLHKHSIRQIWNGSDELSMIRELQPQIKEWVTRSDNAPRLVGFCPGEAAAETGSALAPHEGVLHRIRTLRGHASEEKTRQATRKTLQVLS